MIEGALPQSRSLRRASRRLAARARRACEAGCRARSLHGWIHGVRRERAARRRRLEASCPATGHLPALKVSAAFLCLPLLAACGDSGTAPDAFAPAPPPPTPELIVAGFQSDPAALRRGEALFLGSCVSFCHGLIGEEPAQVDALFLFDCHWEHARDNTELFRIIKEGIPGTRMVGFGDNFPEGDADVWKIIAWIRNSQGRC